MPTTTSAAPVRLTRVEWLICVVAAIGFAFDTYELLMLPLVLPGAIRDLGGVQLGSPEFARWRDLMFYAPAMAGGIFRLLGGHLTRRLGRRPACDPRKPRAVALHADLGPHPGHPPHPHPALPSRVPGVGAQEGRGDAEAPEHPRDIRAPVPADDRGDDPHVRVRLRRGFR